VLAAFCFLAALVFGAPLASMVGFAIAAVRVMSVSFAWAAAVPPHDRGPAEAEWRWRGRRGFAGQVTVG